MNFTCDDLMMFEDKQRVDYYSNPANYLSLITNWIMLSKKDKHKLISHYIDNIEVERHGDKIEIKQVNLLKSYLHDQYNNHNEFGIPSNFELFKDDDGYITLNNELRTSESAIKYFTKFKQFISQYIDCNFNYHEKYYDCKTNVFDVLLKKTERIIRIIALKPDKDIE